MSPDITQDSIVVIVISSFLAIGMASVLACSCITLYRERREENLMQVALLHAAPLHAAPDSLHV